MTNQQKMNEHLAAAEKWQSEVEKYEKAATEEASEIIRSKRDRKQRHLPVVMSPVLLAHIKKVQENDTMFHRAVGNRNSHQTQAQMYALAALVDATTPEPEPVVKRAQPWEAMFCDDVKPGWEHQEHVWRTTDGHEYWCEGA